MCAICIEWEKERLTSKEAFKAMGEVIGITEDENVIQHLQDLSEKIIAKEIPPSESNEQVDQDWWDSTHTED